MVVDNTPFLNNPANNATALTTINMYNISTSALNYVGNPELIWMN